MCMCVHTWIQNLFLHVENSDHVKNNNNKKKSFLKESLDFLEYMFAFVASFLVSLPFRSS